VSRTRRGHFALFAGLLAVSTSAPFFIMARVDAYTAVFWRTALTGVLALGLGWALGRLHWRELGRHLASIALGGALLGGHFLMWVKAFDLTDYASNLLLLVTQPLIAAVVGVRLGERLPRHAFRAIALSLAGMALIAGGDFAMSPSALLGDALSVAAGAAITMFYVSTRAARRVLPTEVFLGAIMLAAAAVALPVALLAGVPLWGFGAANWGWIGAIVIVTTFLGHGFMNYAANHLTLFTVNLVIVLEPAVAIAMGALLFGARVTPLQLVGGTLLGSAVLWGVRGPTMAEAGKPLSSGDNLDLTRGGTEIDPSMPQS
jgi:drug/metabolite transporter (DMT)-like permease